MNNFNYQLNNLELQIIQLLQQSQMPIGIYYLLMSKITKDLEQIYNQQVQIETLEQQQDSVSNSFGEEDLQNQMTFSDQPSEIVAVDPEAE